MTVIFRRPRLMAVMGLSTYLLAGLTVSDVQSVEVAPQTPGHCTAPLLAATPSDRGTAGGAAELTVLQGNAWMLPVRPLLLPYAFSTDRAERLGRLVGMIRACRPDVVTLQEVFETGMVHALAKALPGYRVFTSGETDLTRTVNASGLVTLTRLPGGGAAFHPFHALPADAKPIERLGRKGFLAVDVDADGRRVSVVNLHLYAAREADDRGLAEAQLRQVVDFTRAGANAGRPVVLAGDFNLGRSEIQATVPAGWALSDHGPTYDPPGNPYTVQGANATSGNLDDRRLGRGVRTIDFLVNALPSALQVRSDVLTGVPLSDHWFLEHRIRLQGP